MVFSFVSSTAILSHVPLMERTRYLLADGWTDGGGADAEKGPEGDRASKERFITYWTDGRGGRDAGKRTDGQFFELFSISQTCLTVVSVNSCSVSVI